MRKDPGVRSSQIVEAARAIVEEQGAQALNVQAVTKRVGVSRPLLYHYYNGIEALTDAVVQGYVADFSDRVAAFSADGATLDEVAVSFVRSARRELVENSPLAPSSLDGVTPAYLSYLEKCAPVLAAKLSGDDAVFLRSLACGEDELVVCLKAMLFSTLMLALDEPDLDDAALARICVRPHLTPESRPEEVQAERKGIFGRLFRG